MIKNAITHNISIEDRKVLVFDNLISNQYLDELVRTFYNSPFTKNEIGRSDTSRYPHWAHNLNLTDLNKSELWNITNHCISQSFPNYNWQPYRTYVNYGGPIDPMFSHVDSKNFELTCLWYVIPQWHIDWAGETLFYNSNNEVAFTCTPKPGRLLIFDSRLLHAGRPPSIISQYNRYTLAIKLEAK